jgi:hypothetical protein
VFAEAQNNSEALLKINLPNQNYYSSSNDLPVMEYLHSDDNLTYKAVYESPIKLLTNDSLKNIQIQLMDNSGNLIDIDELESLSIVLKIDYVEQAAITNQYIKETPMRL